MSTQTLLATVVFQQAFDHSHDHITASDSSIGINIILIVGNGWHLGGGELGLLKLLLNWATNKSLEQNLRAPRGGWIGDPAKFNTNSTNLVYKMLVRLNQVVIEWALEKKSITEKSNTRDTVFYPMVQPSNTCLLPRCGVPMDEGCTQPFQVIQWSTWIPQSFSLEFFSRLRGISTSWSLSPLQGWSQEKHKSKGGKATHARLNSQQTHAHKPRREHKTRRREFTTQTVLKFLTRWTDCVIAESRRLRMFCECLV
jgi:hypothetical protein